MGGQVLGGGVIALVAVVLWLVYLLPSWHGRHQFDAAERNAVRLNRALRVLAETSEAPQEVRLELNARTALAQQKLAKQAQSDRERAELERTRAELEVETLRARVEAQTARARAAAEARAAAAHPEVRRARARRRARLMATIVAIAAVALAVWGGVDLVTTGSQVLLWSGVGVAVLCGILLQRMAAVQRRVAERVVEAPVVVRQAGDVQDVSLDADRVAWTPRELPRPLTASAGSRAATVLDEADARAALRRAAVDEAMRARADRLRPPTIAASRAARATRRDEEFTGGPAAGDDAIEAHVRRMLERRASGQ